MRPQGAVLPSTSISQGLGLGRGGEELRIQEFIPEAAVVDAVERSSYDSAKPFCHGEPGSMYAFVVPLFALQVLRACAMNSGPLSLRMYAGAG